MRGVIFGVAIVGSLAGVAAAGPASDPPAAPDKPSEVQEITPDGPVAPTTPTATPEAPPTPSQPAAHTMDELMVPRAQLRFGVNFFGDTSFALSPDTPKSAFTLGSLAIRLMGDLSPSLDALAGFVLETSPTEGSISDVEQLAIRWRRGPGTLEVGRYHTEIGYWNTAYHHGLWLQTPIERPHAVRFEDDGGIVPVHWVGAHYMARTAAGPGTFTVVAGVGNGRGRVVDDVRVLGDNNDAKGVLLKVQYKVANVEVGAGTIYDSIAPETAMVRPSLPGKKIREVLGNLYMALRGQGALAIAEGYAFRHSAGGQSWMTYAGFGVVGYAVTSWLMPYAEIDTIQGANDDPFFTPDPGVTAPVDVTEVLGGIRFETSTWSALKAEVRMTMTTGAKDEYVGIANWSFGL